MHTSISITSNHVLFFASVITIVSSLQVMLLLLYLSVLFSLYYVSLYLSPLMCHKYQHEYICWFYYLGILNCSYQHCIHLLHYLCHCLNVPITTQNYFYQRCYLLQHTHVRHIFDLYYCNNCCSNEHMLTLLCHHLLCYLCLSDATNVTIMWKTTKQKMEAKKVTETIVALSVLY